MRQQVNLAPRSHVVRFWGSSITLCGLGCQGTLTWARLKMREQPNRVPSLEWKQPKAIPLRKKYPHVGLHFNPPKLQLNPFTTHNSTTPHGDFPGMKTSTSRPRLRFHCQDQPVMPHGICDARLVQHDYVTFEFRDFAHLLGLDAFRRKRTVWALVRPIHLMGRGQAVQLFRMSDPFFFFRVKRASRHAARMDFGSPKLRRFPPFCIRQKCLAAKGHKQVLSLHGLEYVFGTP